MAPSAVLAIKIMILFCYNGLEAGKLFPAHLGEVFTFPSVDKGADLLAKPFLLRTPVPIFERFITAFRG